METEKYYANKNIFKAKVLKVT